MAEQRETVAGRSRESIAQLIERSRRVLVHEQRTGHADVAVKPGGLTAFITHFGAEIQAARARGALPVNSFYQDGTPIELVLGDLFRNYQAQDPMQRAANLRSALALLASFAEKSDTAGLPPVPTPAPPPLPLPSTSVHAPRVKTSATSPVAGRPESEYLLRAPVTAIPGVGATQSERLKRLGIATVADLLFTFPRQHLDYSAFDKIAQLPFGEVRTVLGLIWEVENQRIGGGRVVTTARISDETGSVRATWFNQPYLKKQLTRGAYIVLTGIKQRFGNRVEFRVRTHELPEQGDLINTGRLVPVYGLTEGLSPKAMRRITKWAVDHCARLVPEHLPDSLRSRVGLPSCRKPLPRCTFPTSRHYWRRLAAVWLLTSCS